MSPTRKRWPSSWADYVRDRPRWGMIVQVVRYHPEARVMAYHRYFYNPGHVRFLGVLMALVVSTERISAMAARLIATMTISAMNRTTPRWRRDGFEGLAGIAIRVGFMSDRVPELVAHRYDRFVAAVAIVAVRARESAFVSAVRRSTEKRPRNIGRIPVPLLALHHDPDPHGRGISPPASLGYGPWR